MLIRRARLESADYVGPRRCFLTICTAGRQRFFERAEIAAPVRDQFLQSARDEGVLLTAYCFMPDHVHLLTEATADDVDVRAFVKMAKQKTGFAFSREFKKRLWQPSYHDRLLRERESSEAVVRYILENSVRAGLVERVLDYPFSGSSNWSVEDMMRALEVPCWEPAQA